MSNYKAKSRTPFPKYNILYSFTQSLHTGVKGWLVIPYPLCEKEMANYTKFKNVIVTNGIAVRERAKLSFINESRGGGSWGR